MTRTGGLLLAAVAALGIAATGMLAQQTNVDVIANNIANASTAGYRREGYVFSEYVQRLEQQVRRSVPERPLQLHHDPSVVEQPEPVLDHRRP